MQWFRCNKPGHCGERDDSSSSQSTWYRPGLTINYNDESCSYNTGSVILLASRNRDEVSQEPRGRLAVINTQPVRCQTFTCTAGKTVTRTASKTVTGKASKNVTSKSSNSVDPEVIKDRCRVAYGGSGGYFIVEGHGKM